MGSTHSTAALTEASDISYSHYLPPVTSSTSPDSIAAGAAVGRSNFTHGNRTARLPNVCS